MGKFRSALNSGLLKAFIAIAFFSCNLNPQPDLEKEKKEILLIEAKQRVYHFTKNAKAFVKNFSKDFLSVSKGEVAHPTTMQIFDRFNAYFNSVEFVKWDDKKAPIVRFSDDGSLAYVVIDKLVVLKMKDKAGHTLSDTSNFAWVSIYRKDKGGWKGECNISTNK